MTRLSIIVVVVIAVIAVIGLGVALWLTADRSGPSEASRDFFDTSKTYDTTGGQEMRPRWNTQDAGDSAGE